MLLGGLTKWIEHQMEHFTDLGEDELQDLSEPDGMQEMLLTTLHGSLVTFSIIEFKKMCQNFALESSTKAIEDVFESVRVYVREVIEKIQGHIERHVDDGIGNIQKKAASSKGLGQGSQLHRSMTMHVDKLDEALDGHT